MNVKFKNLGKKYQGREEFTLRNINIDIDDKDFCVILGPSGCGKTTLLRMIAGLNSITEGDMIFGDRKVNSVPSKDRDIAMVFQSYALYPHLTVFDNIAFSLKMRKEQKDTVYNKVTDVAKLLKIEEYLYSKPSDISGGQRQRVALGRAIARHPKIFLMDEPLSNLDAKLREHMRIELVKLHKELDATTIYVTHDQVEAMTMATKIILMNDGKVQQVGKPEEFYERPFNIFVAQFIGSPTINIVKGKIERGLFVDDSKKVKVKPTKKDTVLLKSYEGKPVFVGLRTERFLTQKEAEHRFPVIVDIVEHLGKEKTIYAQFKDGQSMTITVPGHHLYESGKKYEVAFDPEAVHFFDGETEERIN